MEHKLDFLIAKNVNKAHIIQIKLVKLQMLAKNVLKERMEVFKDYLNARNALKVPIMIRLAV